MTIDVCPGSWQTEGALACTVPKGREGLGWNVPGTAGGLDCR